MRRRLARLVCRLRGHDPVRFGVGPNWMDACLRCTVKLDEGVEAPGGEVGGRGCC